MQVRSCSPHSRHCCCFLLDQPAQEVGPRCRCLSRGWSRARRGTAPVLKALVRPLHSAGGIQGTPQGLHGAPILPESQRPPTANSFTAPPAPAAPFHSKGPSGKASELPASGHAAWQAGFAPQLPTRGSDGGAGALVHRVERPSPPPRFGANLPAGAPPRKNPAVWRAPRTQRRNSLS